MEGYRPETELLLQLMRAALCRPDSALDWLDGCSAPALAEQIEEQSLVTMLYPTIRGQAGEAWEALAARLKPVYDRELHRGLMQEYEIGALLDDLERDGIDCLPMKGWIMRQYYPDPLMRSMADFDVLLKEMDSQRMQKWMEARGYAPDHIEQSVHDTYRKPPYMNIELHRRLMEEGRLRRQHTAWRENCLASLWQPGFRLEGKAHIYRLSDEDFLVHHLLHFYKHFTGSGVGLRPLADLYLFLQKKGQTLDRAYLEKQLEALHILAFARRMARLAQACLEGQELDQNARLVVEYLTHTGIYGDRATMETARLFQSEGKTIGQSRWNDFFSRCFAPLETMKNTYPRLRRAPWLLPFYWAVRIGRIVFREPYKLAAARTYQTQSRYDHLQEIYRAAGILGDAR